MYLPIYLIRYLLVPNYEKNWNSNVVIHIDKKIHWNSRKHVKCAFGIILFYKMVQWFDGQNIGVEPRNQSSIPFTKYYVEYVYLYIYLVHMCKCIVLGGLWIGRYEAMMGGLVSTYYLSVYYIFIFQIWAFF